MKYHQVKLKIVKTRIFLLSVLFWFSANAFSQQFLVIKFKDGHEQSFPLTDIDKMDFRQSGGNVQQPISIPRPNLTGRWSGTFHNTLGGSGNTILILSDDGNRVTGDWEGGAIPNVQWSGQTLRWNFKNSTAAYSVELQYIGDGKIKLTYQATAGATKYSGYVNDFVRSDVTVKQPVSIPRPILTGRWSGTFHNTLGGSGNTILILSDDGNRVTGDWEGGAIPNVQWKDQTLRWNFRNTTATYSVEVKYIGGGKIKMTYQATAGTTKYSGYVNDFVQY